MTLRFQSKISPSPDNIEILYWWESVCLFCMYLVGVLKFNAYLLMSFMNVTKLMKSGSYKTDDGGNEFNILYNDCVSCCILFNMSNIHDSVYSQ